MRVAFITPEFVTDYAEGGGLGQYLNRMGKLLVERGHQVEIFVSSEREPRVLDHEGMRVQRVAPTSRALPARLLRKTCDLARFSFVSAVLARSHALSAALEARHRQAQFDIVQSADYLAVGWAVRRMKGRVHLVRCSSAADLYNEAEGVVSRDSRWRARLELRTVRHADKAYAPSRFVADHYSRRGGIPVAVVRPPASLEAQPAKGAPDGLPPRFFLHFGQLNRRKGTLWLGAALRRAFLLEPSIRMVWIGRGSFGELSSVLSDLGAHRSHVHVLYPVPKPELYAMLRRADAAVLPSLADNLPNTAIESLMLGVPVIGTRGASIDELVEQGVTGELVTPGDVDGLAGALVRMWRGLSPVQKGFVWRGGVADEMQPDRAIASWLEFAGVAPSGGGHVPDRDDTDLQSRRRAGCYAGEPA